MRLPPYAWQTERHWIESNPAIQRRSAPAAAFAADCAEDVYELRWIEQKTVPAGPKTSGIWIIAGAGVSDGIAAALTTRFQDVGEECVRVADAEELQRVLALSEGCCRGVIRLLGTTGSDARDAAVEAFDLVRTVRAVTSAAGSNAPRLWLMSMGVWHLPADTGEVSAAQSPAWGLGRVIAREHPELGCVNVDLSATADALEIDSLMELLRQNAQEEQLTIRGGQFFAARYERITESKTIPPPQFRSDATYLLTGGLGGIGLKVADWMAKQGARFLALVGRRAPDQATLRNIAALESLGVSVRVFSADLGDDAQVSTLLQRNRSRDAPFARSLPSGGGDRRRPAQRPGSRESRSRHAAQSAWRMEPGSPSRKSGTRFLCSLFFHCRRHQPAGSGQLRDGQRLCGCAGSPSPRERY